MQQLRPIPAFVVFLSGYWPLALVVAALDFDWIELRFGAPYTVFPVLAAMALSCAFTAWHFTRYQKGDRVTVTGVADRSVELLNYAVPYIAGFAGIDTGNLGHVFAMLLVLWVVFYVTYKTHTVVVNPFLLSLGYRLFDLEFKWGNGESGKTLAVSRLPLAVDGEIRIRSIATSCALVVAVLNPPQSIQHEIE